VAIARVFTIVCVVTYMWCGCARTCGVGVHTCEEHVYTYAGVCADVVVHFFGKVGSMLGPRFIHVSSLAAYSSIIISI